MLKHFEIIYKLSLTYNIWKILGLPVTGMWDISESTKLMYTIYGAPRPTGSARAVLSACRHCPCSPVVNNDT